MDTGSLVDSASLGEVAWVDSSGTPRAAGVLPLLHSGHPVLALTFDRADLALSLTGADEVDLVLREPRNTGPAWRPSAWRCTTSLFADVDGETFCEVLLLQELRRYPPARRYADSPLLMREHWWYLPRLLVELDPVAELPPPGRRNGLEDLLLVTVRDGSPVVGGVHQAAGGLSPDWGPEPADGPGALHDQDATFPDLERWDTWSLPVEVAGAHVTDTGPVPVRAPVEMPGLLARWRAERRLATRCRNGLSAWRSA